MAISPEETSPELPPFRIWLAARNDAFLTELLKNRPDTVSPPPAGIDMLAARLQLRASIHHALPHLDALALATLEAAVDLGAETEAIAAADIAAYVRDTLAAAGIPAGEQPTVTHIRGALDTLRTFGLIWGDGPGATGTFSGRPSKASKDSATADYLQVLPDVWPALPTDWSLLSLYSEADAEAIADALADIDPQQRRLLQTLADSGGLGSTKDAASDADPAAPVPRLIAAGLLQRVNEGTVRLPRRVRTIFLGQSAADIRPQLRPQPDAELTVASSTDEAAAGTALETARLVTVLLESLSEQPAATLKSGGVGVREQRRLTAELDVSTEQMHEIAGLAQAAGLIGVGTPSPLPDNDTGNDYWAPTAKADTWLESELAQRWAMLLRAWQHSIWAPWRSSELFSPESQHLALSDLRGLLLQSVTKLPGQYRTADLMADMGRRAPLDLHRFSATTVQHVVASAQAVGIVVPQVGSDTFASSSAAAATLASDEDAVAALEKLTPPTTSQILVQADMTILAPGPLTAEAAAMLDACAELESPGLASMYRITPESVGRALEAGWTGAAISQFLTQNSLTPVPQSVTYLVDDVARRLGQLRGGPALSYLRCDEPAVLAEIMNLRAASALGLRLLAPTVLICQAPLMQLIAAVRDAGHRAIPEDSQGSVINVRPEPVRLFDETEVASPRMRRAPTIGDGHIAAAVAVIRRADSASAATKQGGHTVHSGDSPVAASELRTLLQAAARGNRTVTISYVDRNGRAGSRVVKPISVTGGQVDAVATDTGAVHRFMLHRITDVTGQ